MANRPFASATTQTDPVNEDVIASDEKLAPEARETLLEHKRLVELHESFHWELKKILATSHQEKEALQKNAAKHQDMNTTLMHEISGLKDRLSEIASKKMSEGNPCVEDLSDPLRPTALLQAWEAFFGGAAFWTCFSDVNKSGVTEERAAATVYRACKVTYNACSSFVEELVSDVALTLTKHLGNPPTNVQSAASQADQSSAGNLRKALIPFLPQDAPGRLLQVCAGKMKKDCSKFRVLAKFVEDFAKLCYRMLRQEIPLCVDFSHEPGSPFRESLFTLEDKQKRPPPEALIAFVIRPPLLRQAGGSVLSKGEAALQGHPQTPAPGQRPRSARAQPPSPGGETASQSHPRHRSTHS